MDAIAIQPNLLIKEAKRPVRLRDLDRTQPRLDPSQDILEGVSSLDHPSVVIGIAMSLDPTSSIECGAEPMKHLSWNANLTVLACRDANPVPVGSVATLSAVDHTEAAFGIDESSRPCSLNVVGTRRRVGDPRIGHVSVCEMEALDVTRPEPPTSITIQDS
jgi:hypothetical protein